MKIIISPAKKLDTCNNKLSKKMNFSLINEAQQLIDLLQKKTPKELKERWFKYVQSRVINELYFSIKKQEDNDTLPKKSMKELETQAIDKVSGRIKDWFSRLNQLERGDRFSVYMNSILSLYGPHTNYFPPKDKEDFDITMSGKLEGIGATLTVKDGYIKVSKILMNVTNLIRLEVKPYSNFV